MTERNNRPLAIVMGRNYTMRLCLIQAAGSVGCDVAVIQTQRHQKTIESIDASSRYVVDCKISREPNREELVGLLRGYSSQQRVKIVLPADDYVASVIDEHLDVLKPDFLLPHVDNRQGGVIKLMDKAFLKLLAREAGLNVAKGCIAYCREGRYDIPEGVEYPCFTKPLECYSNGPLKRFLKRCDTQEELQRLLDVVAQKNNMPMMIEQYCPIEKEYALLGMSLGSKTVIPAVIQMSSSKDGLTATGRIFPISRIPHLQEQLCRLMAATHLTGLFDIDMFESNGKLYFNELNVRYGASGFAMNKAVVNLPAMYIRWAMGAEIDLQSIPSNFAEKTFASEKVITEMFLNRSISYGEYKSSLAGADFLSLSDENDKKPFQAFIRHEHLLFFKRWYHDCRRILKKMLS